MAGFLIAIISLPFILIIYAYKVEINKFVRHLNMPNIINMEWFDHDTINRNY